jgi:hypothetical protein
MPHGKALTIGVNAAYSAAILHTTDYAWNEAAEARIREIEANTEEIKARIREMKASREVMELRMFAARRARREAQWLRIENLLVYMRRAQVDGPCQWARAIAFGRFYRERRRATMSDRSTMTPEELFADYARTRAENADKPDRGHRWVDGKWLGYGGRINQVCRACGVIRRRDDNNRPCVGRVPVRLRKEER